jgi:DNA topoisomerase VI subunit A
MRRKTRMLYRIEQIEKERVGQVRLTREIYIESLASRVRTKEENWTFEQQETSRKLGEELEVVLNILR